MNALLEAALARAGEGALIVPLRWTDAAGVCSCSKGGECQSPGKHPLTAQGLDDASRDPATIERWWNKSPRANVGERTDWQPAIDIDLVEVAAELMAAPAFVTKTPTFQTPRGGLHLRLVTQNPVKSSTLYLADGRRLGDLKAERGYVLIPPSAVGNRHYVRLSDERVVPIEVDDPIAWLDQLLSWFGRGLAPRGGESSEHRDWHDLEGTIFDGQGRHNALVSYAGKVWIAGMAAETLVGLLHVINEAQCHPPLANDELHAIAEHFISKRDRREWADISSDGRGEAPKPEPAAGDEYHFVPATKNAFVTDYIAWRSRVNDAAFEYAEAHAIGTIAAVAGPRLRVPVRQKPQPIACNLFIVLVGPSTVSRKSDVQDHTQSLLEEIAPVIEAPGSAEGFVQDLARHQKRGAVLFVDELAWWFSAVKKKTYLSEMKGYVMRAYDGTSISRRNRSKRVKKHGSYEVVEDADIARQPCLTFFGTSTPERLAQVSSGEDLDDGWWPRWIIVWPESRPPMRPMGPPDEEAEGLCDRIEGVLATIDKRLGQGIQAILTDDAWMTANSIFTRMEDQALDDTDHASLYSRMELRVLKVAALLALTDDVRGHGNIVVEPAHVEQADALCQRWLADAVRFADSVGLNEFEYALTRAWTALLRFKDRRAPRRTIARTAHVPARVMDEIERTLQDRGLIDVTEITTNGRSQKLWIGEVSHVT